MNAASIRSEWLKTRKRPLTLWVAGILLAVVLLYPPFAVLVSDVFVVDTSQGLRIWAGSLPEEALAVAQQIRKRMTIPGVVPTTLGVTASIGRVLMVVLGAALAGSEFAWGTARHLIGRTRDRGAFVGSKLTVLFGLALLLVTVALALGSLSGGCLAPFVQDGIAWDFLRLSFLYRLPLALFAAVLSILPYALFAFGITIATRSTVTGLSIGLLTLTVGEPFFAYVLASLPAPWNELVHYIPYSSTQVLKGWMETLIGGAAPDYAWRAAFVLLGYSLALGGWALASLRRRELTA